MTAIQSKLDQMWKRAGDRLPYSPDGCLIEGDVVPGTPDKIKPVLRDAGWEYKGYDDAWMHKQFPGARIAMHTINRTCSRVWIVRNRI